MPMLTPELVIKKQKVKGKKVCFRCEYVGHGVSWLGFGLNHSEAIQDLVRAITNYFEPYESR